MHINYPCKESGKQTEKHVYGWTHKVFFAQARGRTPEKQASGTI
jgi:hypothetical protein